MSIKRIPINQPGNHGMSGFNPLAYVPSPPSLVAFAPATVLCVQLSRSDFDGT